jgi:hypothetical protein
VAAACDYKESSEAMTLVLRMQEAQNRIEGHESVERGVDDYAVLVETHIGRIYSQQLPAGLKWHWSLEVAPASPPNQGIAGTLDEAKAALVKRYEEVKREN